MQQLTNLQRIENDINQNEDIIIGKLKKNNIPVMSIEEYNNNFDNETVNKLLKSESDIENGRTRNATEVIKEFRRQYGF